MWQGHLLDQGKGGFWEVNLDELLGSGPSNSRIAESLGHRQDYISVQILLLEWWGSDGEEYRGSIAITSVADLESITRSADE